MHAAWVKAGGQKGRHESRPVRQAQKAGIPVYPGLLGEKETTIRKRLGRKGGRQAGLCERKASKGACMQADRYENMHATAYTYVAGRQACRKTGLQARKLACRQSSSR
jgi:hypothetical protein